MGKWQTGRHTRGTNLGTWWRRYKKLSMKSAVGQQMKRSKRARSTLAFKGHLGPTGAKGFGHKHDSGSHKRNYQ